MDNLKIVITMLMVLMIYLFLRNNNPESWCNTFSGWPGPLESPFRSNIPALYGNPKYESGCNYKFGLDKTNPYLSMKGYPS